ncbi:MAG: ParB/RepB/Spo0J family partition protein [Beijerinckiaceae bacterium]|nr:ParB/RepB/Spo0J family partition protein [Beijerinckiaceae bacterium]
MGKEKITLSSSRDIPFNKLVLSQSNVRRIKAGVSIEELAEDIARRGLLQGLNVRAIVDAAGEPTGMYEIPAGGRRYRALELLVKQTRLAKTAPVPCVIREGGIAEEDSLAENVQRAPLHPLDQFRAFLTLREKGQSEEEIAAAFFVSVTIVKQRLKLASVSPKLLELYGEDAMTLEQLMAFTVSGDHQHQEDVFEKLSHSYDKQPYAIRRMLTESAVRASDKRAQFVGLERYLDEGGVVLRDLFQSDQGGWLQDVRLLDRLVAEKLTEESDAVRAEGWKWIEVAPEFPYGHTYGLRIIRGDVVPLTPEEEATMAALQAEAALIEQKFADAEEVSEEADQRLSELETAMEALDSRPIVFDPAEIARSGAFVSIDGEGRLKVERGFIRPEDELPLALTIESNGSENQPIDEDTDRDDTAPGAALRQSDRNTIIVEDAQHTDDEAEEGDDTSPISDRLLTELTSYRTLALRKALGDHPEVAILAALHALCLKTFYPYAQDTCLELELKSVGFSAQRPGLADSLVAKALAERHQAWRNALPREATELWRALGEFDSDSRQALFAHCVAQSANAVHETWNRRGRALAHADQLADAVDLDMVATGWVPTVDAYLGRVTKARILSAITEARGEEAANRIAHMKKGEMAATAQELLAGTGWLPEVLRTRGQVTVDASGTATTVKDDTRDNHDDAGTDEAADMMDHQVAAE